MEAGLWPMKKTEKKLWLKKHLKNSMKSLQQLGAGVRCKASSCQTR